VWSNAAVLILVRHGRTAANAQGLLQGRLDLPLDDLGRTQAALLAPVLQGAARVVASPLKRARETAEALGRPVTVDERWVELDYGDLDGLAVEAVGIDVWNRWREDPHFVPAGGESLHDLGRRVVPACEELLAASAHGDVVVVSHVSPIKAAVAWALGVGIETSWRTHLDQASISRIGRGRSGPVLRSFNETHHLHVALGDELRITG
jgi:broad specificity phosphatase PhoE